MNCINCGNLALQVVTTIGAVPSFLPSRVWCSICGTYGPAATDPKEAIRLYVSVPPEDWPGTWGTVNPVDDTNPAELDAGYWREGDGDEWKRGNG